MKRNIKTIAVAVITLVSTVFYAHADSKPFKELNSKEVVMNYVGATLLGSTEYTKEMFANNFEYSNTANNDKFGKKEYVNYLKSVKDLKYNSTQTIEIVDQVGSTTISKVTMDFGTFKRVDHITLIQSAEGWKINKVVTTYP
ncbi:MAG: nuclear transport factor 2 family protein [Sphingobacterium composti]